MNQQSIPWREWSPDPPPDGAQSGPRSEKYTQVLDLLAERLRFESLLSRLSTTFINLPADQVDSQIERGLQQIVEFLDIERSGLAQFSEDSRRLVTTHSYTVPGFPAFPPVDLSGVFPWYTARIREGAVLRF